LPPGEDEPLPRLEVGGPTSLVTGLVFGPDGNTLYEAGWDKIVRVWRRDAALGGFVLDPGATYRVPIGPGTDGAINALALSPDGEWLAVAGHGVFRGAAGFRQLGLIIPATVLTEAMREDRGLIYVFNTRSEPRSARVLRGHRGPVLALRFVPGAGRSPTLLSAARERDDLGVVRLWDVEKAGPLDRAEIALDPKLSSPQTPPGLSSWRTGPGPAQIRVAIAWRDGQFRLWDVEHDGGRPATIPDGRFNSTVAPFAPSWPLTGSLRGGQGRLTLWQGLDGGPRLAEARRPIALVPSGDASEAPWALELAPSKPGGPLDLAAVVVLRVADRAPGQGEAGLRLFDLGASSWGTLRARVMLWPVDLKRMAMPVLAVDPTGRNLAVAGNDGREVLIFGLGDLLHGGAVPRPQPQRLRGVGEIIRGIGFVRNGRALGLKLTGATAELVLDPSRSRLMAEGAGWRVADASTAGWRAEPMPSAVAVRQGAAPVATIRLGPDQVVTALAILPPSPPLGVPIVAVATTDHGEPALYLHDGRSGEQVRQLSGHSERIQSLAFSDDGRLLASASDDHTSCVWSLTDLDQVLGVRGALKGVAVIEANGRLVVGRLDPDSAARVGEALREGDTILGLVAGGDLRAVTSLPDFYRAVSHVRPGEAVTLRRVRGGEAPADVGLRAGQGVDERKPLASILVIRGAGAGEWSWVGWNPLGPYEASDPGAERRLGWHFNTGRPEMPARFALADQYRKFRRDGLLRDLFEQGKLAPPAPPPPRARPDMGLTFDPEGRMDGEGRTLVRRGPRAIELTILDHIWTAEDVESARWALDDAPAQPMAPASVPRTWTGDLSRVAWTRGVHRLIVTLRTREATPQEFSERRPVRYVPPPPTIESEVSASALVVDRPEFAFKARITPSLGPVRARLTHRSSAGSGPVRERSSAGPLAIDERLILEPGINTIELEAENAEALPADRELETSRLAPRVVVYNRAPAQPPEVALERITVLQGGAAGASQSAGGDEPVIVKAPRVRVEGRIIAKEALSEADWLAPSDNKAHRLDAFVPGRSSTFVIREAIDLAPGIQRLRFRARAADSEPTEAQVAIEYRPPVPELADMVLEPADAIVYAEPGADAPRVKLRARLIVPGDPRPSEAVILVNGEERLPRPSVDEGAKTLTSEVQLRPGDNRVQVRFGNAWRSAWISDPIDVTYRRPPRVVAVESGPIGARPFLDLSARVESPSDLPPTRGRFVVKGPGAVGDGTVIDVSEFERDGTAWVVSARDVPIEPGENAVEFSAWNEDGRSRAPGRRAGLVYQLPPPPKPEVEFLSPGRDATVGTRTLAVEFRVRSSSPLSKVELLRLRTESDRQVVHKANVSRPSKDAQGVYEVLAAPLVTLEPRENRLLLVAVNAGGERTAALVIGYLPPPVRVVVDQVRPKERGVKPIVPVARGDNRIAFSESSPSGRVTLQGRVIWPDEESRRQTNAKWAQVWVNGLPQVYVPLEGSRHGPESPFEARIALGRRDNQVEIKVPELAREAGDRPVFRLACTRPEEHLRLHLLIVGVGQEDERVLRDGVLQALRGRLKEGSTTAFATPAFSEGLIYGPLAQEVTRSSLMYQLGRIRNALNPLQTATEAPNEVVLIYYQGGEWIDRGKTYLRLRTGRGRARPDVIALDDLAALFTGTRGAHLFLLDVTRTPISPAVAVLQETPWPSGDNIPIGLLQFAWAKPDQDLPPEPPLDARLITALQESMPRAVTLGQMITHVRERAERLGKLYPNLTFDQVLTTPLAELIIRAP
jgi:WD40 repeat protein